MLSGESLPENKGKVFGFHRAMDTLGAALGPVVALILLSISPGQYAMIFMIAFVPGLIAIFLTFFLKEKKSRPVALKSPGFLSYLKYWKRAGSQYKMIVMALLAFTLFNSSDAFLLLKVKEASGSDQQMITYYIFYNLIYALASYPMGMLADKIGLKTVMFSGLALFGFIYLGFGFALLPLHFVLLFCGYALYAAATEGVSKALISNLAEKEDIATAIGFFTSFSSIFAMLASSLAGLLWFTFSSRVMFCISAAGVFLTLIFLFIATRPGRGQQHA
jgi:MFS family permease